MVPTCVPMSFRTASHEVAIVVLALASGASGILGCNRGEVDSLTFLSESQPVSSLTMEELKHSISPLRVDVFEPYERTQVAFSAMPLDRVLDEAYGPSWRKSEVIVFTCRDGYQSTIPVKRVLDHRAFLAVDRPDGAGFTILKHEEGTKKRVGLSPSYVIWENLEDARIRNEGDYGWPYQVVRIDLVSFRSQFREMTPPPNAATKVLAGFEAFIAHCSQCHAINGRGGTIGPELNYPANPSEYMKDEWLRRWIDDPTSMRRAPRMPPLNPELPERARVIDEIVAYLETMARYKIEPKQP